MLERPTVRTIAAPSAPTVVATGIDADRLARLRRWNLFLALAHGAQAVAIVALSNDFTIAVSTTYPEGPPGTRTPTPELAFDVALGPAVALFLALAALDHLVTATVARGVYERDLAAGINRFRWVEYSISATVMVLLIAMTGGITDVTGLVAIAGANVAMILFGWVQERTNPPGRASTSMTPFWFGTIAGVVPWIAIGINVIGADTVPGFVYAIVVVELVLFFGFGINQWLQYREVGPWRSYGFGEQTYLVLSLAAKSILAWLVFANTLV